MARRHAEMIVRRNGRQEDRQPVVVDMRNVDDLETQLRNWLAVHHWAERHWVDFTAEFRTGEGRPVEVRAIS